MNTPVQLTTDFKHQNERFARAFHLMEQSVRGHVFPAATLTVVHDGKLVAWKGFGRFIYDPDSLEAFPTTIFDVASLTKVIATTPAVMLLYERGQLDLNAPVASIIPEIARPDSRRMAITIRMLLAHSSGLPAYEKLFLKFKGHDEMIAAAAAVPLAHDPGTHAEYSDVGFILLGEIVQRICGEQLDQFCATQIFEPLGMAATSFHPQADLRPSIPPTEDDRTFRHKVIEGEVNDENCYAMGGVAGHAGVFSNGIDIARFAQSMLQGGTPILHAETVSLFTDRQSAPSGTSRALGWDTPSAPSQSGKYFGPHSFGHLGFTGTSLWCDPDRKLSVTLLTNRTWPDRSNQEIKRVRPLVHDAIVEAIEDDAQ